MEDDQKITVVIPAFNASNWIKCCIDSVLAQREVNTEIIVVDDGSTDWTADIASSYPDVILNRQERNGAPNARNVGLTLASSRYIMFLDADDFLHERSINFHFQNIFNKDFELSIGQTLVSHEDGSTGFKKIPETNSYEALLVDWLNGHYAPPCSIVWRTKMIKRIGGWDTRLTRNQDGDLIYRSIVAGARAIGSPRAYSTYRKFSNPNSITAIESPAKLMDLFLTQKQLLEALADNHMLTAKLEETISHSMHLIERIALRNGYSHEYFEVASYRKKQGWPMATGSRFHRVAVGILGLSLKESIVNAIK